MTELQSLQSTLCSLPAWTRKAVVSKLAGHRDQFCLDGRKSRILCCKVWEQPCAGSAHSIHSIPSVPCNSHFNEFNYPWIFSLPNKQNNSNQARHWIHPLKVSEQHCRWCAGFCIPPAWSSLKCLFEKGKLFFAYPSMLFKTFRQTARLQPSPDSINRRSQQNSAWLTLHWGQGLGLV